MKILSVILFLIPTIMMTTCEDDCFSVENRREENIVDLISLSPLESAYERESVLSLKIDLPASNSFFGDPLNLIEETSDHSALILFSDDDLFAENTVTFIKGSQGEFSNWFEMPYNPETEMYELDVQITLNRPGAYSQAKSGMIYLGPSDPRDCSDFLLNTQFMNIEGQFIEFQVTE